METTRLPNWFWISLVAIAAITIGAVLYCNWKRKNLAQDVSETLTTQANEEEVASTNIMDMVASLTNAIQ